MPISIPEKIAKEIELSIFKGELKPHSKLPSERILAETHKVSRPVVREAITQLIRLGLVKSQPKSGNYITDFQSDASLDLLIHIMKTTEEIDSSTLLSFLKFRQMAEPFIAGEAAEIAGEEDKIMLKNAGEKLIASIDNPDSASIADFEFHYAFLEIVDDLIQKLAFNALKPVYHNCTAFYYTLPGTGKSTLDFIKKITNAVNKNNSSKATQVMKDAVSLAEEKLIKSLNLTGVNQPIIFKSC